MPKQRLPFYLAVLAILCGAAGLCFNLFFPANTQALAYIKGVFNVIDLGILFSRESNGYNGLNYVTAIFSGFLLLGGILYFTSKGKEIRLLRSAYALIFLSNVLWLILGTGYLIFGKALSQMDTLGYLTRLFYYAKDIVLIYFTFRLLQYFNNVKELELETHETDFGPQQYTVAAGRGQRFTHVVIDTLLTFFLFSPVLDTLLYWAIGFTSSSAHGGEGSLAFWLAFAVCRITYYVVFEHLFSASPAKMLTETRLTGADGEKPALSWIFARQIFRYTPFDAFSYLANAGWHDRWSRTVVVREKRTGMPGGYYYALPVAFAVVITGYVVISRDIKQSRIERRYAEEKQQYKDELLKKIAQATPADFYLLEKSLGSDSYDGSYKISTVYLKVEQVKADSIGFAVITFYGSSSYDTPSQRKVEQTYAAQRDSLKHITLAKSALKAALIAKNESFETAPGTVKGFMIGNKLYAIKDIQTFYQTNLRLTDRGGYGDNYLSFSVENNGWPADITQIDVIEGDITINSIPPIRVMASAYGNASRDIQGTAKARNVDFKINLIVQDTTGRQQIYQVSGNTGNDEGRNMKRLK